MNIINKNVNLSSWIRENTVNSNCVVELGAGFFRRLSDVHQNVKTKIGVEIYKPYIENATYHNCVKIHGDALKYKELLINYDLDTVLIVDVLEHFNKDIGFNLIESLKNDFNKILLMLPIGEYVQNEDVTGYGGHEYQKHRSYWFSDDVLKIKFSENIIDLNFHQNRKKHNLDSACYFGIWNK